MRQTRGIYLISVVAKTLDMHPQTLRKYERAGFIEPLRMGSLRTYSDEDVARLRLIKHFVDNGATWPVWIGATTYQRADASVLGQLAESIRQIDNAYPWGQVQRPKPKAPHRCRDRGAGGSRSIRARPWSSIPRQMELKIVSSLQLFRCYKRLGYEIFRSQATVNSNISLYFR